MHVPVLNCVCCYTLFCEGETIFSLGMSFYRNDIKYSLCICLFFGRLTRYKNFKEGHKRILVATDLVGRGIDIERVNIVINYDMPDSADTYLHRVNPFRLQLLVIVDILSWVTDVPAISCVTDVRYGPLQVGRAGRFGTKGLAITFVSSSSDSDVLNLVSSLMHCLFGVILSRYCA
jgi:hypothetical protein